MELEAPFVSANPISHSIIQHFSVEGLYGYRTVTMSAPYAANILIAKNGSGKTTLLGAMDAFLRCQFGRFRNLQFSRIVCSIRGEPKDLVITASDIEALMSIPESRDFTLLTRRLGVDPRVLLDFLENDYDATKNYGDLDGDEVFAKFMASCEYNFGEAKKACEKAASLVAGRVPAIDAVRAVLRRVLADIEIVYLPTYRRIELSLGEQNDEIRRGRKRQSIQTKLGLPKRGLFNTDIQFGLSDISERLGELNGELLFRSNQGYREISAKIINDLLDGTVEREASSIGGRPDKQSLALFFSRIKQQQVFPRHFDRVEIPDIEKIYNEGASSDTSNKFLNYFLSKLNEVIDATRSIEDRVDDFIAHCNAYLSSDDSSTEVWGDSENVVASDDKRLEVDRLTLQVSVKSVAADRTVPIDSLSSGEKQMISLFAKLFLYESKKIVLIDEPELSLSIDWQRRILLDVIRAQNCAQLIAITHSPFVFDNELEPYARALSLNVSTPRDERLVSDLFYGEGEDD